MPRNFYIYVDQGGKCPVLSRTRKSMPTHPYYVRYMNNHPVSYRGPLEIVGTNGKLYDYELCEFVDAARIKQV